MLCDSSSRFFLETATLVEAEAFKIEIALGEEFSIPIHLQAGDANRRIRKSHMRLLS